MANSVLNVIYRTVKQGRGTEEAKGDLDKLNKSVSGVQAAFGALAGGAAAGAVLAALKGIWSETQKAVTATVEYAAEVRELSRTIGASAEESSKLIQAADDVGVSVDTLQGALEAAIKRGVSPTIAGIGELADKYNAIQDPIKRTKFLMDNFGKSGADLAPLMEKGADGIKALGDEAARVGLVMSDQAVAAAREYEMAMDDLGDRAEAVQIALGNKVIPVLTDAADKVVDIADAIKLAMVVSDRYTVVNGRLVESQATQLRGMTDLKTWTDADRLAIELFTKEMLAHIESTRRATGATEGWGETFARLKTESEQAAAAIVSTEAANAAAAAASATAQAAAQKSLDDRVTGYYNLATALKDATTAQLAQTEIDQITELRQKGVITLEEEKAAIEAVGLAYGIFTPQSLAMASATDELTKLFAAHRITEEDLVTATRNLSAAAADGKVDLDELGITVKEKVTPEFAVARDKAELFEGKLDDFDGRVVTVTADKQSLIDAAEAAQGYTEKLDGIDGRVVTNTIVTNHNDFYNANGAPTYGTDGYEHGPGFASGVDMIVPPGYPNDSFPFRAESGERVQVTPAGQTPSGGDTWVVNIYANGANAQGVADLLNKDDIRRRTGARRS